MTPTLIATLALLPPAQGGKISQLPTGLDRRPSKLTMAQKLAKVKLIMGTAAKPVFGLTGLAELSVQRPHIEGKATLDANNVFRTDTKNCEFFGIGKNDHSGSFSDGMFVRVYVTVARPGKVHLFSFYMNSLNPEDMAITVSATTTKVTVPRGKYTQLFAFTPTKAGVLEVRLLPGESNWCFYGVDVDVVD